jgi:hypothetical protein
VAIRSSGQESAETAFPLHGYGLAGASGFPLNSASISSMVGRLPWNSAGRVSVICFFPSEKIRVFEDPRGHVGFRRWLGDREIVQGLSGAEVELTLDLDFQVAAAPSAGDGLPDVELAGGRVFDHLEEPDDVSPRQLRNRLFRNWTIREGGGEQAHR